jgi:hypothetical protein
MKAQGGVLATLLKRKRRTLTDPIEAQVLSARVGVIAIGDLGARCRRRLRTVEDRRVRERLGAQHPRAIDGLAQLSRCAAPTRREEQRGQGDGAE